ncbi:uncharacterized protein LOC135818979 [Sycon ciliatum]|uniref:uncharacterized protein LOC135818979 n=1 Tax=Sycon ciliatum TaxID=27933 RepID=UPI0031F69129
MESELAKKVCHFYVTGNCRFSKRCRNLHIDETEGTKELLEMVRKMPQRSGSAAKRPKIQIGSKKDTRPRRSSSATKQRSVARKSTFKKSCRPGKGTAPSTTATSTSGSASILQKDIIPTPEVPTPPVAVHVAPPTCGIEDLVEAMDIQEEEQTE